jgi:hypothetical protein
MSTIIAGWPAERLGAATGYIRQKRRRTKSYFTDLWGALWKVSQAADSELTAEESASTLYRFFRSDHVRDLSIIAKLAVCSFFSIFLIVFACAVVIPIIHFIEHLFLFFFVHLVWHLPQHVFHLVVRLYRLVADSIGGVFNGAATAGPGVGTLFGDGVSLVGHGIWLVLHGVDYVAGHTVGVIFDHLLPALITFVAPAIPICGGIVAWAYLSAGTRLGVVDLFACEILTLCRVITVFDLGKVYVARYDKGIVDPPTAHSGGSVSQEDYFPVFGSNSHDLEALEALVVCNITEFYTYMKAMRDLQRKLADIDNADIAKPILANIIYVLFLGLESGRKAIKVLVEFQPTKAENIMSILLTELVWYSFLCEHFQDATDHSNQLRFARLTLRLTDYKNEVAEIIRKLKLRGENDKDWGPAKDTLPELETRFKSMLRTLLKIEQNYPTPVTLVDKDLRAYLTGAAL